MIAFAATRNVVAPVSFERCPVHGQLVARDGEGRLLGKCSACAGEAMDALIHLYRREGSTEMTSESMAALERARAAQARGTVEPQAESGPEPIVAKLDPTGDQLSPQAQRDRALTQLLAFVGDHVAGTARTLTVNIHGLPLDLFDEDGPFDEVLVRSREDGGRYLVGAKRFGHPGAGQLKVAGFSIDIRERDHTAQADV